MIRLVRSPIRLRRETELAALDAGALGYSLMSLARDAPLADAVLKLHVASSDKHRYTLAMSVRDWRIFRDYVDAALARHEREFGR